MGQTAISNLCGRLRRANFPFSSQLGQNDSMSDKSELVHLDASKGAPLKRFTLPMLSRVPHPSRFCSGGDFPIHWAGEVRAVRGRRFALRSQARVALRSGDNLRGGFSARLKSRRFESGLAPERGSDLFLSVTQGFPPWARFASAPFGSLRSLRAGYSTSLRAGSPGLVSSRV